MAESSTSKETSKLHRLEQILLSQLKNTAKVSFENLRRLTQLQPSSISRAALWLSSKGLAQIEEDTKIMLRLGSEGRRFAEQGVPERVLVDRILRCGGKITVTDLPNVSELSKEDISEISNSDFSRQKNWIAFKKEASLFTCKRDASKGLR